LMMSLWDALRMNMMISYQELVRTFLSDYAEFLYKATNYYSPSSEGSILWNDEAIGIEWPFSQLPELSAKDAAAPLLHQALLTE
ncbi:dTDP-4-dehydrorhamnose 3,5-epimerase, partial [Salmonella sp. NW145]|uniref:dTDP-4-dehydrorhamnose 3,5-epimerase family protein n=1 Tax=Salmonella sp. NW145 TaxID=2947740 RepID=UPI003F469786